LDARHQQSPLRRVDRDLRLREAHRRAARPHHTPRPHPGDERRLLPPQAKPPQTSLTRAAAPPAKRASGEEGRLRYAPAPLLPEIPLHRPLLAPFCSAPVVCLYSALDTHPQLTRDCCCTTSVDGFGGGA